MLPLVLGLIALALLDSMNPFTIAAQGYLLGTPRPFPRSLAFLVGTFVTYFAAGALLLAGWSALLERLKASLPLQVWYVAEAVSGLLLIAFSVWTWRRAAAGNPVKPPADLGVGVTLGFAVVATLEDLPTALPLFAGVDRIAAGTEEQGVRMALLAGYTLLYVSPLAALITLRAALPAARSESLFGRIKSGVDWAFARVLPPLTGLAGIVLLADGARRLVTS